MKNKAIFCIVIGYILAILSLSFMKDFTNYIIAPVLYLFQGKNDLNKVALILEYVLNFIIYFSFGLFLMLYLYPNFESNLKLFSYSILITLTIVVLVLAIKVTYDFDIIKYLFKAIFSILGLVLMFFILEKKNSENKN